MAYTYVLYSRKLDLFYKGSCSDVSDRLHRHNSGRERYTKDGVPWLLMWCTTKSTRSEAQLLEYKLKNLSTQRLIAFMMKYRRDMPSEEAYNLLIEIQSYK